MRESRKRKAISYAESTKSSYDGDDDDDESASEEASQTEESESDESLDIDDDDEEEDGEALTNKVGKDISSKQSSKKSSPHEKVGNRKITNAANRATDISSAPKKLALISSKGAAPRGNIISSSSKDNNTNKNVATPMDVETNIRSTTTVINSDITQGPPVTTDAGAKKLITQYMRQQNRPYSAQQLFDNLHKRIPKATLERVLGLLSNPGEGLLCKEYGKAKIFYVDQSFLPSEKSPEQLDQLQQTVLELQESLKLKVQEEKERKQFLATLRAEPDDNDLDRLVTELEERVLSKKQKIETLQAAVSNGPQLPVKSVRGGKQVSGGPMNLEQATIQYNNYRKAWIERKALCMNAIDVLSEAMGKKRQELISMLDIETDEAAGTSIPPKL